MASQVLDGGKLSPEEIIEELRWKLLIWVPKDHFTTLCSYFPHECRLLPALDVIRAWAGLVDILVPVENSIEVVFAERTIFFIRLTSNSSRNRWPIHQQLILVPGHTKVKRFSHPQALAQGRNSSMNNIRGSNPR